MKTMEEFNTGFQQAVRKLTQNTCYSSTWKLISGALLQFIPVIPTSINLF